jgi:3-deoxy-D-manno-octulosonic acid (KDO) 8-phosphate synthase
MKAIKINKLIISVVFKSLFDKGNRKNVFRVPIVFIETLVKVWEKLEIACCVPTQFLVSPKLSRVFL